MHPTKRTLDDHKQLIDNRGNGGNRGFDSFTHCKDTGKDRLKCFRANSAQCSKRLQQVVFNLRQHPACCVADVFQRVCVVTISLRQIRHCGIHLSDADLSITDHLVECRAALSGCVLQPFVNGNATLGELVNFVLTERSAIRSLLVDACEVAQFGARAGRDLCELVRLRCQVNSSHAAFKQQA